MIIAGDTIRLCRLHGRSLQWIKHRVIGVTRGANGYWVANLGEDAFVELYERNHLRCTVTQPTLESIIRAIMEHYDHFGWADANMEDPDIEVVRYLTDEEMKFIVSARDLRQRLNAHHHQAMVARRQHNEPACCGCLGD